MIRSKTVIYQKNLPKVVSNSEEEQQLTPAERLKLKKEQEALRQAEIMKQASRDS
jgi:hypothetical protein